MAEYIEKNNCSVDGIRQEGTIVDQDEQNYQVKVNVPSACASCTIKGACNMGSENDRIFTIEKDPEASIRNGEKVHLVMSKTSGLKAVLFGYGIPLILLIISLVIFKQFFAEDGLTGLLSLGTVAFYYLLLYMNRSKLKKKFRIKIN